MPLTSVLTLFESIVIVAPLIESNPQWIRIKGHRQELPYPIDIVGNRVKIYKKAFLAWAEENL